MPIKQLRIPLLAIVAFVAITVLSAQENGGGKLPIESDWAGASPTLYNKGDQTFSISLGTMHPLFYLRANGTVTDLKSNLGGAGSLSYSYFLSPHFALGGEFGGMFSSTLGGNMLFILPFGLRATTQIILSPFEFPFSLMVGGASQGYLSTNYFGFIVKPSAGAYWRYNPDWSFGFNATYWWVPQLTASSETTIFGNFLELTLTARYHF
ncbi:MAG: hypothetical protein WCT14_19315 [Treponemataceae bacterium]